MACHAGATPQGAGSPDYPTSGLARLCWLIRGSGGGVQGEALQVGGPGPVEWFAGPPGVEPDQVHCRGGCGVFEAGFGQAEVAGGADAGDAGGLADSALDAGADLVPVFPVLARLPGAGRGDGLVDLTGPQEQAAAVVWGRAGALGPDGAFPAGGDGEPDDECLPLPSEGWWQVSVRWTLYPRQPWPRFSE